jgi:hypothetical protein
MAVSARHRLYLRVAFSRRKTRSKLPDRAIYTVFYRLINGLRRSDPEPGRCPVESDPEPLGV